MLKNVLFAAFFVFSIAFLLLMGQPFTGSALLKAAPAWSLMFVALAFVPGRAGKLLALALLFSSGGDIALEVDRGNYFVLGLSLFLVAHLFYIATFAHTLNPLHARSWALVALSAYVILLTVLLFPNLGTLRIPVLLYIAVITTMGILATFQPNPLVLVGAFLFIFSDSLIAVDKFLVTVPYARYAIMITYYSAQGLLTYGLLQQLTGPVIDASERLMSRLT
jgi:uncharacterized membrane protein YhhN